MAQTNRGRILLLEDFAFAGEALREILMDEGYYVRLVADGDEALEALESEPFDLLLADLKVPGASGRAVLVRAAQIAPEMPRAVISGEAPGEDLPEVSGVLRKPIEIADAIDLVTRLVAEGRAPDGGDTGSS